MLTEQANVLGSMYFEDTCALAHQLCASFAHYFIEHLRMQIIIVIIRFQVASSLTEFKAVMWPF